MSSSTSNIFTLFGPSHIQTVQLLGSWDNYSHRYNMAPSQSNPGTWELKLKFPETGSSSLKRYWYYYILDGYFESHDPNKSTIQEPTRGITMNILDLVRRSPFCASWPEPDFNRVPIIAPKPHKPMAAHVLTLGTAATRPYVYSIYSDVATISSSRPNS